MKAIVIHAHGERDQLRLEDVPTPEPARGQVRVAVRACGLNYLDVFVRRGMPGMHIDLPRITGGDIAGVIDALGADVSGLQVGQRVLLDPAIALPNGEIGALGEHATGGLAETIVVAAENVIPLPDAVTFEQAAALPIAYGTAWRMLITRGRLQAGETILILGASGGVGTGCVQIARMRGAVIYAAASSDEKIARLQHIGADYGVNYKAEPEFHRALRSLRGGAGVDVVVNFTGGDTWVRSLKCLNFGGRLLTCGAKKPMTHIIHSGWVCCMSFRPKREDLS